LIKNNWTITYTFLGKIVSKFIGEKYSTKYRYHKTKKEVTHCWDNLFKKVGGYLLFHLDGSTIGVGGLNFSVRNGKRCISTAITTLIHSYKTY
jgi:hypothetical protein